MAEHSTNNNQNNNLKFTNVYDDGNIPQVDLPRDKAQSSTKSAESVEPLPESFRPRKDGPGGD